MTNKTKRLTLEDNGKKLTFELKKMPATQAEDFLYRCIRLLGMNANTLELNGKDYVTLINSLMRAPYVETKALLDELLGTVSRVVGNTTQSLSYEDMDGFIDNPLTLIQLRVEAIKFNFGFFTSGNPLSFLGGLSTKPTSEKSEE